MILHEDWVLQGVTCQENISTCKYPLMTKDCWEMALLGDKVILKMTETPELFHQRDFQAGFSEMGLIALNCPI